MNRLLCFGIQALKNVSKPSPTLVSQLSGFKTLARKELRSSTTSLDILTRNELLKVCGISSLCSERSNKYGRNPILATQIRHITEDRETTALTVWGSIKELKSSPVPALAYGFSGLIPFIAVPAYMTMSQLYFPQMAFAQLAYGAAILSFLGGVRWGFVLPEGSVHKPNWFNLGYSVMPSLVAWVGLLLPYPMSSLCVMTGLMGAAYFDTALPGYPPWFKGLRFVLSIVAVLSLWTTFMCQFLLKSAESLEEKEKS